MSERFRVNYGDGLVSVNESEWRRYISRQASIANKRLDRLEKNGLTWARAYKEWERAGGVRFRVKGKTNEELKRDRIAIKNFLDSTTSTVRGVNQVVRNSMKALDVDTSKLKPKELIEKGRNIYQARDVAKQILESHGIGELLNYGSGRGMELTNDLLAETGRTLDDLDFSDPIAAGVEIAELIAGKDVIRDTGNVRDYWS